MRYAYPATLPDVPEAITWGATRREEAKNRELALHDAMLEARVSNSELADRLELEEKTVRRLRDPLQRSALGSVEAALRCLGKRVEVSVSDAA